MATSATCGDCGQLYNTTMAQEIDCVSIDRVVIYYLWCKIMHKYTVVTVENILFSY